MAFQVKPFRVLIAMTKEKLEETMVPLRVRAAKAKAESLKVSVETDLLGLEAKINNACADKDIDFGKVADLMDDYALKERRLKQITDLVEHLFPQDTVAE